MDIITRLRLLASLGLSAILSRVTSLESALDALEETVDGLDGGAGVDDAISDGETARASSQNAVFDALALKAAIDGTAQIKITRDSDYGFRHAGDTVEVTTFVDGTYGYLGTKSNHDLAFFTNDGNGQWFLKKSGKFGIGTNNPTAWIEAQVPVADEVIRFIQAENGKYVGFKLPALASDITYTLPATGPANGQALSGTAVAGVLEWVTPTATAEIVPSKVVVFNPDESTLQDAIDAAELLAAADVEAGVVILCPPGDFTAQNGLIKKNISIVGLGSARDTGFGTITVRPISDVAMYTKVLLKNIYGALAVYNETAAASGIFNPADSGGVFVEDCILDITANRVQNLLVRRGTTDGVFTYCEQVDFIDAQCGVIEWHSDDSASNLPTGYSGGNLSFVGGKVGEVAPVKDGGSVTTYFSAKSTFFDLITLVGEVDFRLSNCGVKDWTISGSNNTCIEHTGWVKRSFVFSEFVTGREAETNTELPLINIPIGSFIKNGIMRFDSDWNDPGDGLPIRLMCNSQQLCGGNDLSGSSDFYVTATQANLDSPVERVREIARTVTVLVNPGEFGAHIMSDITTGALTAWVEIAALPITE